ncbi:MAG: hypothetical protein ABI634_12815 [Acidobacteriota bacterium]
MESILAFITERRDALSELEAAIMKTQHLFAQPLGVALAPATLAPAALPAAVIEAPVRRGPGRPRTVKPAVPRQGKGGRGRVERPDLTPAVLAFLERQREPTTFGTLVAALQSRPALVRPCLDALVQTKQVLRTGVKNGQRIGLPGVMGSAPAPVAATPTQAKPRHVNATSATSEEIAKVLADGASYDAKEVYRRCRGHVVDLDLDDVVAALEQFVKAGHAERIPLGEGIVRYRRRGKVKATA